MSLFNKRPEAEETREDGANSIGKNLSFASTEAYKKLRTNLTYSLPLAENERCRVIGIISAYKGEGKSITAINLSYSLAEAGNKVVVIEADMRLPGIAKRIGINSVPGLSDYLVAADKNLAIIKRSSLNPNLYVIPAGNIPPNPSELLGSDGMELLINTLKKQFDYVIIDLLPIGIVADALVVAKHVDGMLLVVRQNYCRKKALDEVIREFQFSGTKILGVVFNRVKMNEKKYSAGKYGYRYKSYGYGYGKRTVDKTADKPADKDE